MDNDLISRKDAVRILQDAREQGSFDLRGLIAGVQGLPAANCSSQLARDAAEEIADMVGFDVNVKDASGRTVFDIIRKHFPATAAPVGQSPVVSDNAGMVEWQRKESEKLNPVAATGAKSSDAAWREWFDRLGEKATAEVVNATADLVTNERLAALVSRGILPDPNGTPVEGESK